MSHGGGGARHPTSHGRPPYCFSISAATVCRSTLTARDGVGKAARGVKRFVLVARDGVALTMDWKAWPAPSEEAVEEKCAVTVVIGRAIPFCENVCSLLSPVSTQFACSSDEIVYVLIDRFHVGGELARLDVPSKRHFSCWGEGAGAALRAGSNALGRCEIRGNLEESRFLG